MPGLHSGTEIRYNPLFLTRIMSEYVAGTAFVSAGRNDGWAINQHFSFCTFGLWHLNPIVLVHVTSIASHSGDADQPSPQGCFRAGLANILALDESRWPMH